MILVHAEAVKNLRTVMVEIYNIDANDTKT